MATFEEGGDKGYLIPGIIYFMPWNKNKKHQKLIYSTELSLKTLKNWFFAIISIEFRGTLVGSRAQS
jgi:hypothetical protein